MVQNREKVDEMVDEGILVGDLLVPPHLMYFWNMMSADDKLEYWERASLVAKSMGQSPISLTFVVMDELVQPGCDPESFS